MYVYIYNIYNIDVCVCVDFFVCCNHTHTPWTVHVCCIVESDLRTSATQNISSGLVGRRLVAQNLTVYR